MSLKRNRAPRAREPGPAVELWIYRYDTSATNRGGRRELVFNAKPEGGAEHSLYRLFGAGRYRLEWRDERRWLVRVKVVDVAKNGLRDGPKPKAVKRTVPPPKPLPRRAVRGEPLIERPREDGAPANKPPKSELLGPPRDLANDVAVMEWLDHLAREIHESLQRVHRMVEKAAKRDAVGKGTLARNRRTIGEVSAALGDFVARAAEMRERARTRAGAEQIHSWAAPVVRRLRKVERDVEAKTVTSKTKSRARIDPRT